MNEFRPDSVLTDTELENIELRAKVARLESLVPKEEEKHKWSWYQDLKQRDPKLYWSATVQTKLEYDMATLGADFADGDFYSNKFKDSYERRDQRRQGKDLYVMGTSELVGSV